MHWFTSSLYLDLTGASLNKLSVIMLDNRTVGAFVTPLAGHRAAFVPTPARDTHYGLWRGLGEAYKSSRTFCILLQLLHRRLNFFAFHNTIPTYLHHGSTTSSLLPLLQEQALSQVTFQPWCS